MMNITQALATFAVHASEIPTLVRKRATLAIADTYATVVAGRAEPAVQVLHDGLVPLAGTGRSRVVGTARKMDPATAALLNGAAAHALDYDVISFAVSGFIGSATICALTALVEDGHEATGEDVVTAYCVGWEAAAALARGINPLHYAKGWHPTATMGLMSATFASCRLLGLDVSATVSALAVAVADASGVKTMIGNMANPYHVGKGARNAVVAARLAAAGFRGHSDALGARQGFLNLFQGPDGYDVGAITGSLGTAWDLVEPGPVFKVYPCCGLIHSGLDAVLALRAEHGLTARDIESVQVLVHEYVPGVMDVRIPSTGYEAKFSIPYCIAAGIKDGQVGLGAFTSVDPTTVALSERVTYGVHPELQGGDTFFEKEFTEVTITTHDRELTRRVQRLQNRGTGSWADREDLRKKLADCFAHGRVGELAEAEWKRIMAIDQSEPWQLWSPEVIRPLPA
jgi:2-methylcitrate dehydratase PrpD